MPPLRGVSGAFGWQLALVSLFLVGRQVGQLARSSVMLLGMML